MDLIADLHWALLCAHALGCSHSLYGLDHPCAHTAGSRQVNSRCIGVNYDEHGVGGHCHLQVASRVRPYSSTECPRYASTTLNNGGVCMKKDTLTSRPLCSSGGHGLLHGAPPCVVSAGRINFVGMMCFFSGDVGPSEGTAFAGCLVGEGYVGDGYTNNTLPTTTAKCSKCALRHGAVAT